MRSPIHSPTVSAQEEKILGGGFDHDLDLLRQVSYLESHLCEAREYLLRDKRQVYDGLPRSSMCISFTGG